MNDRALVSVRRIFSILKCENSDNLSIVRLSVLGNKTKDCGWQVIINHTQEKYDIGDLVVFFEIDSVLPSNVKEFGFMASCKYRVKTVKLRGHLSQGLILPIVKVREIMKNMCSKLLLTTNNCYEGQDLTSYLGVKKFVSSEESKLYNVNETRHTFPLDICEKTREERIQNINISKWGDYSKNCVVTEKLDGTSATFVFDENGLLTHVCSRNFCLPNKNNSVYWKIGEKLQTNIHKHIEENGNNVLQHFPCVIQGEICGPKIQNNRYQLSELKLFVFTVSQTKKKCSECSHTQPIKRLSVLNKVFDQFVQAMGVTKVPVIEPSVDISDKNVSYILEKYSKGFSTLHPNIKREGVVIRSNQDPNKSFKAINNDVLLKQK